METDELEQLRAEVEELRAVSEDTNRVVHKMRRSIWWGRLWTLVWWVGVFGLSAGAYYYYMQPLLTQAMNYYDKFQAQNAQAQNWGQEAQQLFEQYAGYFKAPQQSPQVGSGQQ